MKFPLYNIFEYLKISFMSFCLKLSIKAFGVLLTIERGGGKKIERLIQFMSTVLGRNPRTPTTSILI